MKRREMMQAARTTDGLLEAWAATDAFRAAGAAGRHFAERLEACPLVCGEAGRAE